MVEMTDYEINKRLAEIAGFEWAELDGRFQYARLNHPDFGSMWAPEWSPLTDWSQLGPLMERFGAWPEPYNFDRPDGYWEGCCETGPAWADVFDTESGWPRSEDMKRAICLAIIAAHEEE